MSALTRLFRRFRPSKEPQQAPPATPEIQWVIAGLGNPGEQYARSRHNAGFMTVEQIAASASAEFGRKRFKGVVADARIAELRVMLVKPQTYYNLSGECVAAVLGYFHVPSARLIVVHDEMDLEIGRLRLKQGGSDAGNRGIRSIEEALGTADFIRVRIGIGRPPANEDPKEYLVKPMTRAELDSFSKILERARQAAEAIATDGLERAMARHNQRT